MDDHGVRALAGRAADRYGFWLPFLSSQRVRTVAEVGVYRGAFAARLLDGCPTIGRYYMVDPWRHLEDWNKPANRGDDTFEDFYRETLRRTEAHADTRVVLRGRTQDVADQITDGELDFAYVDGDHTLRGITTDLMQIYPKVRDGGWIGGDDFSRSIFQHSVQYEPTLVFPYAVYFAEAVGARIYALPYKQFLLEKAPPGGYEFVDTTGKYGTTSLKSRLDRAVRRARKQAQQSKQAPAPRPASPARRVLRRLARR